MSVPEIHKDAYLREATEKDMELLFRWANDGKVRENSFSEKSISWEDHKQWFESILYDDQIRQYIFMIDGEDVGQIRIRLEGRIAEISYSVAAEYRCMGYAKRMVSSLTKEVKEHFPQIKYLKAQVKPGNIASKRVFTDLGYTETCSVFELSMDGNVKNHGITDNEIAESARNKKGNIKNEKGNTDRHA